MKSFITFFTLRPVFASMVGLMVILIGAVSFSRVPQDLLPDVELPVISVIVSYPNVGPEEIEELVTRPLEQVLAGVPGVEEMVSQSSEGQSSVTLNLVWGTSLDEASNDVRDRLDRVINRLPEDASRPQLRKFDPNQRSIVVLGVASDLDAVPLRRLLDQLVQPRLEQVPGVAEVSIFGGLEGEVHVELNPDRMQALGIPVNRVLDAIRASNVIAPAGDIRDGERGIMVRTPALLESVDEVANVIIERRGDTSILLRDIATVVDGSRDITRITRINGQPGVRLGARKQSGANTVETAQAVLRAVEVVNRDFPQIEIYALEDRSVFIRNSLRNVAIAIGMGSLLAIIVLIFFLRNGRSTFAVSVAIPFSLIGTFILIYYQGMTLNLFTLGGLALGVGLMVDNAIVVVENIYRHRSNCANIREAAIRGASEVSPAIVASTLTTLAIFVPLLFMGGVAGLLFRQLAFVVAFSLLCSLLAALTVVPMLAGNLPERMRMGKRAPAWSRWALGIQEFIAGIYGHILDFAFRFSKTVFTLIATSSLAAFWIIPQLGAEFFPESDEGQVQINADLDRGMRIEVASEFLRPLEKRIQELVPEIANMDMDLGASNWRPGSGSSARFRLNLVPLAERSRSSEEIALDLQRKLVNTPGIRIRSRASGGAFNFGRLGIGGDEGERLTLEIVGFDLATLDAFGAQAVAVIEDVQGVTGVRAAREVGVPRLAVRFDRERAADLGLNAEQVGRALQTFVGGSRAGALRGESGEEVDIRVRLQNARDYSPDDLLNLQIQTTDGRLVAIGNFASLEPEVGSAQVLRRNQQRVNSLSIDVGGRDIATVAEDIRIALNTIPRPENLQFSIRGDYEEQQKAFRELIISLVLALLLVYMVMACLYESLRNPIIVMFSVPLAASGALVVLWLTNTTLNVQSFIGFIMLVGIVVNNAILIVDQANRNRLDGMTAREAAQAAGKTRFRPILMTMLTTVLALFPLALGWGEGSEAQASLARVVVGGLISSSLITLILIPIIYPWFHPKSKASPREAT